MLWELSWVWFSAALILATAEVLVPGYIFLGFALGALALGLVSMVVPLGGLAITLVTFSVLSLVAYLVIRSVFGLKTGSVKIWDRDINDN